MFLLNRSKYLAFFSFGSSLDLDMEEVDFIKKLYLFFRIHVCGFSLDDPLLFMRKNLGAKHM